MIQVDVKNEALTYYLLNYICIYENQYSQKIDYLMFTDIDNIVNSNSNSNICIFKVGLDKIYKFLCSFKTYQISINDENEIIFKCENKENCFHFKIYMITEEKCKKFPQIKNNEIDLNLFLHVIDSFTTVKFKKNIMDNGIPQEYK